MPLELNELETARFGVVAAHLVDTKASMESVDRAASRLGVEMLTARIDVGELSTVHLLEAAGFQLMDTVVSYGRLTSNYSTQSNPGEMMIRLAEPSDAADVGAIAGQAFRDYYGHFHADPRLDGGAADAAYVEWAEVSTANIDNSRPVLLCCEDDSVLGFLTLRNIGEPIAEIVLNAVAVDHRRRGIYAALVESALVHAERAGTARLTVSTQINNYNVQRVWARLGFVHECSVYTFHKWYNT